MAKRQHLTPEAYERQVAPLLEYGKKAKIPNRPKNKNISLSVDEETHATLKKIPRWQDKARIAIAQMIEQELGITLPQ